MESAVPPEEHETEDDTDDDDHEPLRAIEGHADGGEQPERKDADGDFRGDVFMSVHGGDPEV